MSKRGKKLKTEIGTFLRQYARKAQRGVEPNDRRYDEDTPLFIGQVSTKKLQIKNGSCYVKKHCAKLR